MVSRRVLPTKFIGGLLGIGAGLALGREGPTIQMGAAVGQVVSNWLRSTARERQTLIAAGAGAGLAAAFNAPLSGVVFVLEELQRDFTPAVFGAAFVAAVAADIVTRTITGQSPVFHVVVSETPPIVSLPAFAVLGLLAGLFGVLFNRALIGSLDAFERVRTKSGALRGAVAGGAAGLIAWFAPSVVGTGSDMLETMFGGKLGSAMLVGLFALRFALTMLSYGSGAPGGIFAPLLVLGAQLGLLLGTLAGGAVPSISAASSSFAVVGMAAFFAATVRAPLTAIVLIVEMTGGYVLMLPLLIACVAAYATADALGDLPIYERLVERELLRGTGRSTLESPLLVDLRLFPGAPIEDKEVRELTLPKACLLVSLRRGREEIVPTPETCLRAGDDLVLLVAPEAADAVGRLRDATRPRPPST
jgi:CIC family chloride channel protein